MDTVERGNFWKTLNSFDGNDVDAEMSLINKTIKYPRYLYRFRSINSNTLDGLRSNRLYFSSADKYDDPFDSFIHIDWGKVEKEITEEFKRIDVQNKELDILQRTFNISPEIVSNLINQHNVDEWTKIGKNIIENTRRDIQKDNLSICFSEEKLNEVLWLKYAGNHSGFLMEYDITDEASFLCGKSDECKNCLASIESHPLYPVYYSSEKYDATSYAKYTAINGLLKNLPVNIASAIRSALPAMTWQRERISLIKHKCHEYDKEWRMIHSSFNSENKRRPFIVWRPSSIILGLRIQQADKNIICTLAREAGISNIYQCFINKSDELDTYMI